MSEINVEQLTPMMRQYVEMRRQHPDKLMFYRLGDFYEMFFDDAKVAASILDLTLTRRGNQGGEPIPMAGVPVHTAESYITRLMKAGYSVVICDQLTDKSAAGNNMIERRITRIYTPGTATDEGMIPEKQDNIIAAVFGEKNSFGFATLSLGSGHFTTTEVNSINDLLMFIAKTSPAELLYPEHFTHYQDLAEVLCRKALPLWDFDFKNAQALLCEQFKTKSLTGFDLDKLHAGVCAAGALLKYVKDMQKVDIEHITGITHDRSSDIVLLDKNAQRNLELSKNLSGNDEGTLLSVLDDTRTAMGSRLLRHMMTNPLRDNQQINERLDLVEAFMQCPTADELGMELASIGDIERIVARIGLRSAKPRDLSKLREALATLPKIKQLMVNAWPEYASLQPEVAALAESEGDGTHNAYPAPTAMGEQQDLAAEPRTAEPAPTEDSTAADTTSSESAEASASNADAEAEAEAESEAEPAATAATPESATTASTVNADGAVDSAEAASADLSHHSEEASNSYGAAAVAASENTATTENTTAETGASGGDGEAETDAKRRFAQMLINQAAQIPDSAEVLDLLQRAIMEFPALLIRDGGVIAAGYNAELDELRDLQNGSEHTLAEIEEREKERTGINTLRVRFNNVHGYYIEVSRGAAEKVPMDYIRRQTLKNSERFITPELKELEEKTLSAQTRSLQIEKELYTQLLELLITHLPTLSSFAHSIARLDAMMALARVAVKRHYFRPELVSDSLIKITAGRHPVVEALSNTPFIANGIELNDKRNLAVISGPNMGGKSTFMRQTALIAIMARMGSFVPATQAVIGDIDRIFTRIGASDDLASGRSTFMVEMEETATILNNATTKSLVIMDEVGRGTSGAEGAAIAEAIVQYIAKDLKAKTLFATHYTEVTTLIENYANAFNLCFNAQEFNGKIVFLYHAEPGRQSRSFGIEVAQLAGVPAKITKRAVGFYRAHAKELESQDLFTPPLLGAVPADSNNTTAAEEAISDSATTAAQSKGDAHEALTQAVERIKVLEAQVRESSARAEAAESEYERYVQLAQRIRALEVEQLTPLEALNTLYQLKEMLCKGN